jgi:hypothetical protein
MQPRRAASGIGRRTFGAVFVALMLAGGVAEGGEPPEQFRVWGRKAAPHPYLGDPGLDGPGAVVFDGTPDEKAHAFAVLQAAPFALPGADAAPAARCAALSARDAAGSYGPLAFALLPFEPGAFSVTVSALAGPGGRSIGAEHLDVRAVRYVKVSYQKKTETIPLLLEAFGAKALPARRLQLVWITYHLPDDAPAGVYEGRVRVLRDGAEKLALPLRLEVLPFPLAPVDLHLYMYTSRPASLETYARDLADQRCHGMTLSAIPLPVTPKGDLTREAFAPWLDAYRTAAFPRPFFFADLYNRVTAEWLNAPDKSIKMYGAWFRYYAFSETLDRRFVEIVRLIRDESRARGLAPILAVADEAGSHPWTIPATKHYNELAKREVPEVLRELTCGGGWAMGEPEHEHWKGLLDIWSTNRWLPDKLEIVRRENPTAKIQLYNMGGAGSAPGGMGSARNLFGYFTWKAKADGAAQWVYEMTSATPEHNYAWPAEDANDGKVPTVRWEAVREGVKDRRYVATLERTLEGKTGEAADAARRLLDEIAAKVELRTTDYDPINGGRIAAPAPEVFEAWRARIVDAIVKLR